MKGVMFVVNVLLMIASGIGIVWHLLCSQFGIAWLCVIPLVYAYFNLCAIEGD